MRSPAIASRRAISITWSSAWPTPTSWFRYGSGSNSPVLLLERLPKLKLIALVGRNSSGHRFQGLHGARHSGFDRQEQFSGRAGRIDGRIDPRGAAQRRARGGAHEARRLAVHPVAPAARVHLGHFRPRHDRSAGRRGRPRPGHGHSGLRPEALRRPRRRPRVTPSRATRPICSSAPTFSRCMCGCDPRRPASSRPRISRA